MADRMIDIDIKVDLKEAERLLNSTLRASMSLQPVFAGSIDKSVSQLFLRRFASEGAWGDRPWIRLRPLTLKLRQESGHGRGGILRDTNRLWASLVKVGPESVRVITARTYSRGTAVPYARFHQTGWNQRMIFGRRRKQTVRVPARPIVPEHIPREMIQSWEKVVARYIEEEGRKGAS